ncbi:MAG: ABC transporter ATP-binding protein [Lachnospiraceae bacterium]|nr:ABC transporter ATP-binding protein [Lachnospiraceae bacterium]
MEAFRFGLSYWKKYLPAAIFIQFLSFIALTCDLLIPMISEMFIDYIIQSGTPDKSNIFSFMLSGRYGAVHTMELFFSLSVLLLSLLFIRLVLVYIKNVNNQKLGLGLETDLRMATFQKLSELDSMTISDYNTGELLTTINSDTIMFKEMFCRIVPNIIDSICVLIVSIVLLARIHPWLLLIPVMLAPVFATALIRFRRLARENYKAIRGNNSKMNLTVQENIEAVRLVRSFTNEKIEKEKFDVVNEELKDSYINQIKLSSRFEVVFSVVKQTAYIGSIAVSAMLVINGEIMVGFLVACTNYILKIMDHITQINNSLFQMQQQLVSGQKMCSFMGKPSRIGNGTKPVKNTEKTDISLKHVYIEADGAAILKDINLEIPSGKKVGIVGGTGCGKSVLLESLVRIYDITGGSIKLNGTEINEYELSALRDRFAYVFQDVFLFSNTIDSNIAYSEPDIEREQIITAARHAQAHSFIQNLPDSYETIVGERGLGISGGQKQRISIARALLKDAPVLVLDDSTSALDVRTEKKLLEDIKENYPDKTILISAHRLSSVVSCDEILYMQDGMITERGTFDELMALNGRFAKVYRIQEAQSKEIINYGEDNNGKEKYLFPGRSYK